MVPRDMPWDQADLAIRTSARAMGRLGGETGRNGALRKDQFPAALLLPMGRLGPAFLAYHNFDVYLNWNNSLVYSLTAAYFATRLAGAPKVNPGHGSPRVMSLGQVKGFSKFVTRRL